MGQTHSHSICLAQYQLVTACCERLLVHIVLCLQNHAVGITSCMLVRNDRVQPLNNIETGAPTC